MVRIPDAVNVVSLDTHALIVAVPLDGPADVSSSLPRPVAADVLRQIADQLDAQPCPTAAATGQPCPIHDTPTAPARPRGLDDLLATVADQMQQAADEEPATPAEGDKYVKRAAPDEGRVVTVENVWTADDGHTAVAYKWHDPRSSYAGSACPLDVFHRTYAPATEPAAQ